MPKLHYWADLAYIAYEHQCRIEQQSVKQLSNIIRVDIENPITLEIIRSVLRARPLEEGKVRFLSFEANSKEAKALVAAPNGAGVAWMLLTHRRQLGWKTIARVTVMTDAECLHEDRLTSESPHLWFEMADVEAQ